MNKTIALALFLLPAITHADDGVVNPAPIGGPPQIYAPDGHYLGNLSRNPYDPNSTSNPYGRYGSRYSPDSINNPYGRYGSPYSSQSPNNPYGQGGRVYGR